MLLDNDEHQKTKACFMGLYLDLYLEKMERRTNISPWAYILGGLYSEGLQRKKVVGLYLGGLIFGGGLTFGGLRYMIHT